MSFTTQVVAITGMDATRVYAQAACVRIAMSFVALLVITGFANSASAQEPQPNPDTHRFAVEVDVVQLFVPTVHIIKPKLSWTAWGTAGGLRGDLLFALYIRPHIEHDIVDTIDEYMVGLGYRQYFHRGLHLEALLLAGLAWGTNSVNGEDYTTATLFGEVNVGYRFGFFEPGGFAYDGDERIGFFIAPQFGTIFSLGVADIGPRDGKPDWFLQGNLLIGLSF